LIESFRFCLGKNMMKNFSATLLAHLQAEAKIAVLTGAGISAESGLSTFRGQGGLWKNYRPENLATPEAFHEFLQGKAGEILPALANRIKQV
jgi:NAD-dependent SIR2 family protein deacetylase